MPSPDLTKVDTQAVLRALAQDADLGVCVHCGAEADGVEPDTRGRKCQSCGQRGVYGAEELVIMLDGRL